MVKTVLHFEETVDMPIEEIISQYKKPQLTEPFVYNGKKYALIEWSHKSDISEPEPHLEVFVKEIK